MLYFLFEMIIKLLNLFIKWKLKLKNYHYTTILSNEKLVQKFTVFPPWWLVLSLAPWRKNLFLCEDRQWWVKKILSAHQTATTKINTLFGHINKCVNILKLWHSIQKALIVKGLSHLLKIFFKETKTRNFCSDFKLKIKKNFFI